MPNRKTPVSSNYVNAALLANTLRTIFTPASNTTGIKIHSGNCFEYSNTTGYGHFVIAATAPVTMSDGLNVTGSFCVGVGTSNVSAYMIKDETFIPAGYGLYWMSAANGVGTVTDVSWSAA